MPVLDVDPLVEFEADFGEVGDFFVAEFGVESNAGGVGDGDTRDSLCDALVGDAFEEFSIKGGTNALASGGLGQVDGGFGGEAVGVSGFPLAGVGEAENSVVLFIDQPRILFGDVMDTFGHDVFGDGFFFKTGEVVGDVGVIDGAESRCVLGCCGSNHGGLPV